MKKRHVEKAYDKMVLAAIETGMDIRDTPTSWIELENLADEKGVAPIVKFIIQSDPISEVGVNGCQAIDMLEYVKCLFESLDEAFPCRENNMTIENLESAIAWQNKRTADREIRGVEGQNKL